MGKEAGSAGEEGEAIPVTIKEIASRNDEEV